jgi:3-oxoacyl-[acyl-carrier protein] reductase
MAVAGKVAIVTGGGSGIGEATARLLAAEGVNIVIADLNEENAKKVADSITSEGKAKALPFKANVASMDDAEALVNFALEKFGEVSILINNAGVVRDTLIPTMSRDQWDLVLDVNLGGCFNMMKACARPMMQKRYGRIVNTSSIAGRYGGRGQGNYAASKAGIDALTRVLAQELASKKRNITVNGVAPGMIETPLSQQVRDLTQNRVQELIPLERYGTPQDVARVIRFLVSEDADYINGQTIVIDGGLSLGVKW